MTSDHPRRRQPVADAGLPPGTRSPLERAGRSPADHAVSRNAAAQDGSASSGVLAAHALLALAWTATTALVAVPVARATGVTPAVVAVLAALVYVAASSVGLAVVMRRSRRAADPPVTARTTPPELDRLRAMFLTAVSHELRTPVTNVVGYAETLHAHGRELTASELDHLTGRLVANGERLERLVTDLLSLHPGTDHGGEPERTVVDVDALIGEVVDEVVGEVVAAHAGSLDAVRLHLDAGTALLDGHALRRIVAELLDNVARHTPTGTTATISAMRHGGSVLLAVEDDGPGIPPEVVGTVADPFVQGLGTADDPAPGLGIGLAIAAHHADRHGGQLSLSTAAGGGARVTVVLPAPLVIPEASRSDRAG